MKKIKRILDSVHGHLFIPTRYFEEIIDKDTFQRLKRIEQTSARSIFPSARHDRFIHSLGVYWIGRKIIDSFEQRNSDILSHPLYKQVSSSYLLACLLHDVGHSPFSHTFEKYYDNVETQKLDNLLKDTLQNKTFSDDLDNSMSAAPHEKLSAYLAHQEFGCFIDSEGADKELVVRMIIGCRYSQSNDDNGFRNAFIDLIHGDLIDADRLDYACRDVWASGYQTANIDMDRLIDSIYIEKNGADYQVCYSYKALNEVESVFAVKDFQQKYVITHHTVVYEQELLVKAMQSAALYHFNKDVNTVDDKMRKETLMKLCDYMSLTSFVTLPKHDIKLHHPCDDDFVSLMKFQEDDKYISQWLSRQYKLKPLWKSKADFYNTFRCLIGKKYTKNLWLFTDDCKDYISQSYGIPKEDVWILEATSKDPIDIKKQINIRFDDGTFTPYYKLFPIPQDIPKAQPFFYIYVPESFADIQNILSGLVLEMEKWAY